MYVIYTICMLAPIIYFLIYIGNAEKEQHSIEMAKYLDRIEKAEKEPFLYVLTNTIKKIGLSLLIIAIFMIGGFCLYCSYRLTMKLYYKSPTLQEEVNNIKNLEYTPFKILKEMAQ